MNYPDAMTKREWYEVCPDADDRGELCRGAYGKGCPDNAAVETHTDCTYCHDEQFRCPSCSEQHYETCEAPGAYCDACGEGIYWHPEHKTCEELTREINERERLKRDQLGSYDGPKASELRLIREAQ